MNTAIATNEDAKAWGFTREIFAESGAQSLSLLVKPDADLDGTFKAWCMDELEFLAVNGWVCTIEDCT